MGRISRPGRVAVSVLGACAAWILLSDPDSPIPHGEEPARPSESLRPVVYPGPSAPLPPRVDGRGLDRVLVPTDLREPTAAYDRSLLPLDFSMIRPADLAGPVSRRPRGVGIEGSAPVPTRADRETVDPPRPEPATKAAGGQVLAVIETTDFNDNQINTGGRLFTPPDTNGAAGPDHLVSVTNVTVRFHEKDGSLIYDSSLADFFADFSPQTYTFDPRVIYDQVAGRFVVITTEFTDVQFGYPSDTARIYVAVSDDADPEGTWYQAAMNVRLTFFNEYLGYSTHHWIDFPGLAVDEEAVYIHGRAVSNFSTGGATGGYRLFVLDKGLGSGGLYDGGTLSAAVYDPFAGGAGIAVTSQPAHIFGTPGAGVGTWLVGYSGLSDGVNEFLQVVRIDDPLGAISFTPQFVALGDIEDTAAALPDATQSGTSVRLETNARRALNAVWRNDTLWTVTHVAGRGADAGQVSAHWYRLTTPPGTSGSVSLADQGNISGNDIAAGIHTFFPSIAVNDRDEAVIGFSASGPSIFPSAYAAVRLPGDPPGSTGPSLLVRAGVTFYVRTFGAAENRWGDYSAVAVDPSDQCFWVHNQYAKLQGTFLNNEGGRWATAFGRLCVSDCGNGATEAPEACDDGNAIDGDACSNVCQINACGPTDTDGDSLGDGCDPDDDDDGAFDTDDCAPLNPDAAVLPQEVEALRVESSSPGLIVWSSQSGAAYDVATGLLSTLRTEMGPASATCLADDVALPQALDSRPNPHQGDGYYYMVRAQNACGDGGYGTGTGGMERQPAAACP